MPTTQVAALTGSALITLWNLFCGFLIPKNSIPDVWIWIYWLAPTRYVIESLEASQFYCDYFYVDGNQTTNNCSCKTVSVINSDGTTSTDYVWHYVNQAYSFDYGFRWWDVLVLVLMIIVVQAGKFVGFKYVSHLKR